jgi:DNA excision repair protein ERCC-4
MMLPALRGLAQLADYAPIVAIDRREQDPIPFHRLKTQPATLLTGDYSIAGLEHLFSVERKTISDLVGCCVGDSRDRFERELHRIRGFRFRRLLIVGSEEDLRAGRYRSNIKPKAVLATLAAFEIRYDTPVIYAATPRTAGRLVEKWAWYFAREITNQANDLLRGCREEVKP